MDFESLYRSDLLKALEFAVGFFAPVRYELYGRSAPFLRWKLACVSLPEGIFVLPVVKELAGRENMLYRLFQHLVAVTTVKT